MANLEKMQKSVDEANLQVKRKNNQSTDWKQNWKARARKRKNSNGSIRQMGI